MLLKGPPREKGEKEGREASKKVAKGLGVLSFYLGLALNMVFAFYNWTRPLALRLKARPLFTYKRALTSHALSNMALAAAALYHSIYFMEKARILEYALAAVMLVLVASGTVMTYMSIRNLKRLAAMIHFQRALALTLLILAVIHIAFKP